MLSRRRSLGLLRHPMLVLLHYVATGLMAFSVGAIYWHTGKDTGGIQVGARMAGGLGQGRGRGSRR